MDKIYRIDLDVLKGIAIIGVVLFHLGVIKSGYLGVDVFLVINGFLIVPSICKKLSADSFSYAEFIKSRILRLWPQVILLTFVCLAIGYIGMLPDDYENIGESVVASNLFSENILLSITTKDYWNVSNDYNPLMHLWYVGLIFEFYLLFPLILMLLKNVRESRFQVKKLFEGVIVSLLIISIAIYIIPGDDGAKFYYLPYRLFEFLLGGICGLYSLRFLTNKCVYGGIITLLTILILSSIIYLDIHSIGTDILKLGGSNNNDVRTLLFPKQIMLLATVGLATIAIIAGRNEKFFCSGILTYFGKRSYSIFIWHQPIIAFYRYFFSTKVSVGFIILFILILFALTELTYRLVEKAFLKCKYSLMATVIGAILVSSVGGYIYFRAGVVRNVPELDVYTNNVQRGMHAAYVDRVYKFDKDFPNPNGKINVLIEGVSYGRDMANVLLESPYADSVNISYVHKWSPKYIERIKKADRIFTFKGRNEVPAYVIENKKPDCNLWGIGTKNYGQSNGIIYTKRFRKDYYDQTVPLHPWYRAKNEEWKKSWNNNYIDFISLALVDNDHIRVFTEDHKLISQDCYHLTQSGARWYAKKIDFAKIFK